MEVQTLEGLARQVDLVLSLDAIEAEVKFYKYLIKP